VDHHHLIPRARGGSDEDTNMVTLCRECHGLLHGVTWSNDHCELVRAGLAAAKRRGVKLGGDRGARLTAKARRMGWEACTARANARAADLVPTISELRANGITSLRAIAAALNERRIPTPRGTGKWLAGSVSQLLARLGQGASIKHRRGPLAETGPIKSQSPESRSAARPSFPYMSGQKNRAPPLGCARVRTGPADAGGRYLNAAAPAAQGDARRCDRALSRRARHAAAHFGGVWASRNEVKAERKHDHNNRFRKHEDRIRQFT
jgi:hypothetical protein